ncbi:hypothetical protein BDZ89DRAFT_1136330 [Hymenopellis radicata]|nr:hypothetical protein BDZ89DRAFT_1136330 [Hymenopellis radicata]
MPIETFALSALGDYDADDSDVEGKILPCVSLVCNITLNNATSVTPTYLDSGATIHCVKDRQRFTKYRLERSDGNTADAAFVIEGRGIAQFDVKVDGVVKGILLDAVHTPTFTMNLISVPALDVRGFRGTWGSGILTVVEPQTGRTAVSG